MSREFPTIEILGAYIPLPGDLRRFNEEVRQALTPRELEIVRMVSAGLRNRAVADKLCISEGTVKVHLHNIYEKLSVTGRLELALYARNRGIV